MSDVAAILRALADLAPGDTTADHLLDVTGGSDPIAPLRDEVAPLALFAAEAGPVPLPWRHESAAIERLRAIDALHREEQRLRVGWLFLCGPARVGGTVRRVCMPLLQRPVHVSVRAGQALVEPLGDAEPVLLVGDGAAIDLPHLGAPDPPPAYEARIPDGPDRPREGPMSAAELANDRRTHEWVDRVVAAAGLQPVERVVPAGDLAALRAGPELVVVGALALFLAPTERVTAGRGALLEWSHRKGTSRTAFAHLYGLAPTGVRIEAGEEEPPRPLPLTVAQEEALRRSRRDAITVVSGAPGNGKSHLVCAVAIDAVARGESVLVATPSPHAADVLGELLARQPGPPPVSFGGGGGRRSMIAALEVLAEQTVPDTAVRERREELARVRRERSVAERAVLGALERERRSARAGRWTLRMPDLRAAAPRLFEADADHEEARRRLAALRSKPGWWRRRRVRTLTGGDAGDVDLLADALEAAADVRAELELDAIGGTTIGSAWDVLLAAEAAERDAEGRYVDGIARASERWRGDGRRAVAALLRALPAGRAVRRDRLAAIDAGALVRALPLWVGTLRDVEELLPAEAALFDVVVVDEAAQVDQFRAAGALLRARRAVVVGDPRQLRHVSFVADADVAATLDHHGVAGLADRLDVRRQSLYDVAAGAGEVTFLDEHFRSVPHLIGFSARRFYEDRVKVATRNPVNEAEDVIDVVAAPDVAGEVAVAVDLVASLVEAGVVGIGAVTPFRKHADALEAALLERFEPEVIEAHGLRTGTAHAAQGSERDHLVVALGLAEDDPPARWRFAEDPNLFNVLVTRARRRLTVVTALDPATVRRGIVADYLRYADRPPIPPSGAPGEGSWTAALATELERNGVPVRVGYPVGRWTVDICAGTGPEAVALDCEVHPDGPAAHVDRHRSLRCAGWQVVDAFASRWDADAAAAAVDLRSQLA